MELLKHLFENVVTTAVIAREFGSTLPQWVHIKEVKDVHFEYTLDVDAGEASAISLAMESYRPLLILDDNKGRKLARRLNLNFTGSLGIFLKAKQVGLIPSVKTIIDKVQQTNFRYTQTVLNEIVLLAGE